MGKEKREKREEAREIKREEKAAAATACAREKSPVPDGRETHFQSKAKKISALQTKGEVHETRFFQLTKILEILT